MGWLSRYFKGSSHRVSEGQYHGNNGAYGVWNEPSSSWDALSEYENEDVDRAIALSLSEKEQKKARATAIGYVLDVILRLVMDAFLVAWMLIGIQNVFAAMPIPTNMNGLIEYRAHPFWLQKYCPSHEKDGTPRCCSCERMEVGFRTSISSSRGIITSQKQEAFVYLRSRLSAG
ncbi:hypothetical protein BHE74_00014862 [Ensete ventricosum]|nr:hypothetical protein GW17_00029303 [Ensete ventricosum]RWW77002.1 hypothetical protein BHE74_00014862 [Ensete ventricosum]